MPKESSPGREISELLLTDGAWELTAGWTCGMLECASVLCERYTNNPDRKFLLLL